MTDTARAFLNAFETLSPADQKELAAAILRCSAADGDSLEGDLLRAADNLFKDYDAAEARRGTS